MDLSVKRRIVLSLGLILGLGLASVPASATTAVNQAAVNSGIAYLGTQQQPDGQIAGFTGINAWAMMAYTAAGSSNTNLRAYLLAHPPASTAAATEWERGILAVTADHQNPYNFGGTNYVAGLKSTFSGGQIGSVAAVNDDAFGILALTAARVPATDPVLTAAVNVILAHQHADGGFGYSAEATGTSDVDDTAAFIAAIQAAQTAGVTNSGLSAAKTAAQSYLLSKQNPDGGFLSDPAWGTDSNVSSTAVALIALNSLGLGGSVQATNAANYLKNTQQPDGSFPYQLPVPEGETGDTFDSAYAVTALAGASWPQVVYAGDLPAVTASPSPSASPAATPTVTPVPVAADSQTSPLPSPAGSVLGASTLLPDVGTLANQILLMLAALIATASGIIVYRRQKA